MGDARWEFGGVVAPRLVANVDQWLLRAPEANPAMLGMFRLRERRISPPLEVWAGEFAGKYLLSAVQAIRLDERADLRAHTARFVRDLLATQAEDGYMGPFPRQERLLRHWDLWGHYHVMQGLLAWHDLTREEAALTAARRAADLICRTFLDGQRRVFDAGSHEMNMAVSHVLANLHRRTGEPRYLAMTQAIVKDWERAGDYLRTGLARVPFYRTPRPRWESLHDVQALAELWRITGEPRYREAFTNHWHSLRDFDRRTTGAFSGGETATGNPFAPTPIETCCTVAWMALTGDMLRLTGEPTVADELELATFNAALGAQHPSGRWWTYDTPMDGERKASAHQIVFQARAGSPELNCCSVNGPRTLGMLSEWAVMRDVRGWVVNWLGPLRFTTGDGKTAITCETAYPIEGRIVWQVTSAEPVRVRFRVPAWAEGARARLGSSALPVRAGSYLDLERIWAPGDRLELELPMAVRALTGRREQTGKVSLSRGPVLLAYDQQDNPLDEDAVPPLDLAKLNEAKLVSGTRPDEPWLQLEIPTAKGSLRLRDFANAGASGTRYRSWLRLAGAGVPLGPDGLILSAALRGTPQPQFGRLVEATAVVGIEAGRAVRLNGTDDMITYGLPEQLGPDFTVAVRVRLRALPSARLGQLFSAWAGPMDDPLRLTVESGQLSAQMEAGRVFATGGFQLPLNEWQEVVAVKEGTTLKLYVNGQQRAATAVPATFSTAARMCAIGGNPLFTGPEFVPADFSDLLVRNRALTAAEVVALKWP